MVHSPGNRLVHFVEIGHPVHAGDPVVTSALQMWGHIRHAQTLEKNVFSEIAKGALNWKSNDAGVKGYVRDYAEITRLEESIASEKWSITPHEIEYMPADPTESDKKLSYFGNLEEVRRRFLLTVEEQRRTIIAPPDDVLKVELEELVNAAKDTGNRQVEDAFERAMSHVPKVDSREKKRSEPTHAAGAGSARAKEELAEDAAAERERIRKKREEAEAADAEKARKKKEEEAAKGEYKIGVGSARVH